MTESSQSHPRSTQHVIFNWLISIGILCVCLLAYTYLGKRKQPTRTKPHKPTATVVATQPLRLHEGPVPIAANGVVVPLREIRLSTEVAGRIVQQSENLRNGRMVSQGEVLIKLDPIEYELEVKRLHRQQSQEAAELAAIDVSIENTKQVLSLAENQLELAKVELTRLQSLMQRQAASASELDLARRTELTSQSALVELQNRRRELVAQRQLVLEKQALTLIAIERAELDLDRATVISPLRGRVVQSSVEKDSYVAAGTSFVTIEDTSAVEVRSSLTANQMFWVWNMISPSTSPGSPPDSRDDRVPAVPALISYRSGNQTYQCDAVLERIDGAGIDLATRTYPCLFRVDSPESIAPSSLSNTSAVGPDRLMRGMFVSVNLLATTHQTLYQIPEIAIRPGNRIWLNTDGKLKIVPIEMVGRLDDAVVVRLNADIDALPSHQSVVTSPVSDPRDGLPIMVGNEAVFNEMPTSIIADDSATPTPIDGRSPKVDG